MAAMLKSQYFLLLKNEQTQSNRQKFAMKKDA